MVGLSCAAVHDVPDWRGCKLRRGIVHIPHIGLVAISSAESTSVVVGEGDCAATTVGLVKAAHSAHINFEGIASEAKMGV